MAFNKPCPKCGGRTDTGKHEEGWGHLRKCRDCGWEGKWMPKMSVTLSDIEKELDEHYHIGNAKGALELALFVCTAVAGLKREFEPHSPDIAHLDAAAKILTNLAEEE